MGEVVNFKKEEKRLHKYVKGNFDIDQQDPLSPEYLQQSYDTANQFNEGMSGIADSAEKLSQSQYLGERAKKVLAKDAIRYHKEGAVALEGTVKAAADYVEKNNGYYHEQAKADMEADLSKRKVA